jgi:drug/metabolite transporter (DMT)-like permease
MKNRNLRGGLYVGLFLAGLALVVFGATRVEDLGDLLVAVALAATAAGNLLARAFLSPPGPEPREIDPLDPNS